jgi:alkylated DNA nucleotide flippase Atl1
MTPIESSVAAERAFNASRARFVDLATLVRVHRARLVTPAPVDGRLPPGRWSTYGDLAGLVGTAAQPLGLHISKCPECLNAHRVLGSDGRVRPNFAWSDPTDGRKPEDLLRAEGVQVSDGVVSAEYRITTDEVERIAADGAGGRSQTRSRHKHAIQRNPGSNQDWYWRLVRGTAATIHHCREDAGPPR